MNYDRVVVLDQGRVVEFGQPGQLLESAGLFRDLWNAASNSTVE
jgi:ABC-type multidrug transport system fused ATPase/permease subunit